MVDNRALEEFRERLLRWGELCTQLRELYYRYLDLAAFRSEKCYFPGRRCVRSWKRKYDVGDLTLMWTYIANTAPLCGKLMKALAEVEYKARLKALESLKKYSGVEKRTNPSGKSEIVIVYLRKPVYAYLALWRNRLYIIWGEFEGLPRKPQLRATEVERRVIEIVKGHNRNDDNALIEVFDVDEEYDRLWLELSLSNSVSTLLGGRNSVPVVLFRNLGWLLSDDVRKDVAHRTNNFGQMATRLFDWIALIEYAIKKLWISPNVPLIFRLVIDRVAKTEKGYSPSLRARPLGVTREIILTIYNWFGIRLGSTENVLAHGYTLLNALRGEAVKRENSTYVVNDVNAWIAFSNIVDLLIIGDGYVNPVMLGVAVKTAPRATLKEITSYKKELAKALGGAMAGSGVQLQIWHARLLLPIPPVPIFEKTIQLYKTLTNYPMAAVVKLNGNAYLLTHNKPRSFVIGKKRATALYITLKRLGLRAKFTRKLMILTFTQLKELNRRGVIVRFLNEIEVDPIREISPVSVPDLETLKRVLREVATLARIVPSTDREKLFFRIIPHDKTRLGEIAAMLSTTGIRFFIMRRQKEIWIYEKRSVEAVRTAIQELFS